MRKSGWIFGLIMVAGLLLCLALAGCSGMDLEIRPVGTPGSNDYAVSVSPRELDEDSKTDWQELLTLGLAVIGGGSIYPAVIRPRRIARELANGKKGT